MFKELYQHIYEICRNTEDIMGIFSEELAEMGRNFTKLYRLINEFCRNAENGTIEE